MVASVSVLESIRKELAQFIFSLIFCSHNKNDRIKMRRANFCAQTVLQNLFVYSVRCGSK